MRRRWGGDQGQASANCQQGGRQGRPAVVEDVYSPVGFQTRRHRGGAARRRRSLEEGAQASDNNPARQMYEGKGGRWGA